ncbi:hypothetical protein L873DRAFT_725796 [Choiromyces venosus 120613-1]|uniref:Uncharacterized protein n=1 Tax=Choiromyces venosus 120613-1 TaxID=1336337 RepID=A0A3N4JUZ2_9PEZI|nr:hypothetical protein L873DRAFT_725796 [Choiromyces venosus 120613-1]
MHKVRRGGHIVEVFCQSLPLSSVFKNEGFGRSRSPRPKLMVKKRKLVSCTGSWEGVLSLSLFYSNTTIQSRSRSPTALAAGTVRTAFRGGEQIQYPSRYPICLLSENSCSQHTPARSSACILVEVIRNDLSEIPIFGHELEGVIGKKSVARLPIWLTEIYGMMGREFREQVLSSVLCKDTGKVCCRGKWEKNDARWRESGGSTQ